MKKILLAFTAMLLAACSSTPATIDTGADAVQTFDGLYPVDNAIFRQAWADPDVDFSQYNKILPGGAFFEYRAVKNKSTTAGRVNSSQSDFYIDDAGREKLAELTTEVFKEELSKSTRFTVVDEVGPDVLIIRGGLHDIVSKVPPDQMGRGDIYLSSVGEITLVLEAVDSRSGEVIYRAVERRAAESGGGMAMRSSSVTTLSEVRRLLRRWAKTLTDGLDSIPEA
jgi:hypothetical protein